MKPAPDIHAASAAPTRVEFSMQFSRGQKGARRVRVAAPAVSTLTMPPLPRPAALLVPAPDLVVPRPASKPPVCVVAEPHATACDAAVPEQTDTRATAAPHVPKITLLLVLGHHFEHLVRDGVVRNYSEIARQTGLTRARVTQIANLTMLAPEIQDEVLILGDSDGSSRKSHERELRWVVALADWREQRQLCRRLASDTWRHVSTLT